MSLLLWVLLVPCISSACWLLRGWSVLGVLLTLCRSLPFYYCVRCARSAVALDFTWDAWGLPLLVSAASAAVLTLLACLCFYLSTRKG